MSSVIKAGKKSGSLISHGLGWPGAIQEGSRSDNWGDWGRFDNFSSDCSGQNFGVFAMKKVSIKDPWIRLQSAVDCFNFGDHRRLWTRDFTAQPRRAEVKEGSWFKAQPIESYSLVEMKSTLKMLKPTLIIKKKLSDGTRQK